MKTQTWVQWSPPSTQQWLKQPVRSLANNIRRNNPGSLQKFLICATKGENWEWNDFNLKGLRNTGKWTTTSKGAWKKAKENWIGKQCSEIEGNLRKNNSKRAYQLVKDLTTVKQRKATAVQNNSEKNASQRSDRYWTDGQNTALSCTTTRPVSYTHLTLPTMPDV